MRFKCFLLVTGLALLLGPTVGMSQFGGQPGSPPAGAGGQPGGFGGRGGGGFGSRDPNDRWNQYTGGKAVWKRSEITDPNMASRFDRIAQMVGATKGEITKDQYVGMMQGMAQRFSQGNTAPGGAGRGAPGAAQPTAGFPGAASPGATFARGQQGPWNQQAGWNQQGGGNWRGNSGRGGNGGNFNPDAIAEFRFRQMDTNGDGLLNYDEMAQDEALQSEKDKWDTNKDGMIDLDEFKAYMRARIQQFQAGGPGGQQGWNPMQLVEDDADKKPTVYRAGKLPPNLPAWFRQYDTDGDGQIGLYEWKAAGQPIAQFEAMDLNGDGFVTVEEVMRTVAPKVANAAAPGSGTGGPTAMGPGGFGGGNRGPGGFGTAPGGQGGDPGGGFGRGNRGPRGFGPAQGGQGSDPTAPGGQGGGRGNRGFGRGNRGPGGNG